ncbi:hypothetical protein M513_13296 [Trichuris suis]|uniref:Uncharacterized protein n=1 Tax=Trichuris suis TaxID=68888 RepID=A0A085LLI5_9BILA|nr:hypothetical protein M513_13296 [Trichuris suis]
MQLKIKMSTKRKKFHANAYLSYPVSLTFRPIRISAFGILTLTPGQHIEIAHTAKVVIVPGEDFDSAVMISRR